MYVLVCAKIKSLFLSSVCIKNEKEVGSAAKKDPKSYTDWPIVHAAITAEMVVLLGTKKKLYVIIKRRMNTLMYTTIRILYRKPDLNFPSPFLHSHKGIM